MPTLAQLYEYHAQDCLRSAAETDDPERRDMLLTDAPTWLAAELLRGPHCV
jgi:hypothetical protein